MPSLGTVGKYLIPGGPGVRIDSAIYSGYTIPPYYDSMLGKVIVWALDWEGAVKKAKRALDEYYLEGLTTNISLHREIVKDDIFKSGHFDTGYLDNKLESFNEQAKDKQTHHKKHLSFLDKLLQRGLINDKGDFL